MKISAPGGLALILLAGAPVWAQPAPTAAPEHAAPAAEAFVRGFYAWYRQKERDAYAPPHERPRDIEAGLAAALRADEAAAKATPGEIVGVDYDVFTCSQEWPIAVTVTGSTLEGPGYWVSLRACQDGQCWAMGMSLIRRAGRYLISDIHCLDESEHWSSLRSELADLAKARAKPGP